MALPDYFTHEVGTSIIWGTSGGSGVTNNMNLNNLANNAGRNGVKADLGANWYDEMVIWLVVESGTAPAAGKTFELFMACSHDDTAWPGGATGTDAAYQAGNEDAFKKRFGPPVSILIATASTNTTMRQNPVIWRPQHRYIAPVVVNKLGQATRNQGTPADNTSRVIAIPRRLLVQDAA